MTSFLSLEDLLGHMQWADALIWEAVLSSLDVRSDSALHDRLYHIHVTQHAFLQVWRGLHAELPAPNTLDIVSLGTWARHFYAQALSDRSWLDADALQCGIPESLASRAEERLGAGAGAERVAMIDTVLQVVLHTTYHRGQVNARLRELGVEPPLTEYFVWMWRGKPAADWPEVTSGSAPN